LTASGQGITLTAASAVVFAEMTWTPGLMIQAEDRAHRIGQQKCVSIYYMYGEDTLDTLVFPRLRLKSEVISSVVDGSIDNSFNIKEAVNVPIYKVID
jgi:SWI/SNF-related matrix-associated actin-dependent regulator 1 of chromatin subfamily A